MVPAAMPRASFTAVVPVYNEEACLPQCLASLRAQDVGALEIVVVDDGSADRSVAIAEAAGARVLRQEHRGPGAARNLGARHARGDVLVFADADMVLAPDYVSRLVAPIVAGEAMGTCHWDELVLNWESRWARAQTCYLGLPERRKQPLAAPAHEEVFRAVRRDFFLQAGGFSEGEGRGDDASLARRTGVVAVIVRGARCYHRGPESLGEAMREAVWHGQNIPVEPAHRLRRSLATLARRNPLREACRGVVRGMRRREPSVPLYALGYSLAFSYGVLYALTTRRYVK